MLYINYISIQNLLDETTFPFPHSCVRENAETHKNRKTPRSNYYVFLSTSLIEIKLSTKKREKKKRKGCSATDNRQDEHDRNWGMVFEARQHACVRANASATVAWNDSNFGARSSRCNVRFDRFTTRPPSYGLSHPEMELLGTRYTPTTSTA